MEPTSGNIRLHSVFTAPILYKIMYLNPCSSLLHSVDMSHAIIQFYSKILKQHTFHVIIWPHTQAFSIQLFFACSTNIGGSLVKLAT